MGTPELLPLQTSELRDLLVTCDPQIRPAVHLNVRSQCRLNYLLLYAKSSCCCLSSILPQLPYISIGRTGAGVTKRTCSTGRPHPMFFFPEDSFRLGSYFISFSRMGLQHVHCFRLQSFSHAVWPLRVLEIFRHGRPGQVVKFTSMILLLVLWPDLCINKSRHGNEYTN